MPPNSASHNPKERRSGRRKSIVDSLHFSGKVIMASVLFGFGLLLVGAILMVIAVGKQEKPILMEESQEEKSPMTFVGPGVMGVGGLFVVVGTIMCLIETRVLKRRRLTLSDNRPLVTSEDPPAVLGESIEAAESSQKRQEVTKEVEKEILSNSIQDTQIGDNVDGKENLEKNLKAKDNTFSHVAEVHSEEIMERQTDLVKKTTISDDCRELSSPEEKSGNGNTEVKVAESRPSKDKVTDAQSRNEEINDSHRTQVKVIGEGSNTDAKGQLHSSSSDEEKIQIEIVESQQNAPKEITDGEIDRDLTDKEISCGDKKVDDKTKVQMMEGQQSAEKETINEDKEREVQLEKEAKAVDAGDNALSDTFRENS